MAKTKAEPKQDAEKGKKNGKPKDASIAANPRAVAYVRRTKGWAGLGGFLIAAYLSYSANTPFPITGARALGAGVACYVVAWALSVTFWRYRMIADLQGGIEALRREAESRKAANSAP